jgi:NAD(P)-dependent dehydrogenase (short-subunit alcohol dehydrogenase family)
MATMSGKTAVVTGATSGIGKAIAVGLAKQGMKVVVLARDEKKGESTLALVREAGGKDAEVQIGDLASLDSIRSAARAIAGKHPKVHVLVNCAGVSPGERSTTVDGNETTMAVNHLGPYLLTRLLLPQLRAASGRIVVLSSSAHSSTADDVADLQSEKSWSFMGVYQKSKLLNLLFTFELARRLEGTGVTVNAVHPGVVRTELARDARGFMKVMFKLMLPFFSTPEQGADTSIWLATSDEVDGKTGGYYAKRALAKPAANANDRELQKSVWEKSAKLAGLPVELDAPRATATA